MTEATCLNLYGQMLSRGSRVKVVTLHEARIAGTFRKVLVDALAQIRPYDPRVMKRHRSKSRHIKKYFRYCTHCGWGFTRNQWRAATYCGHCGSHLHDTSHRPRGRHSQKHQPVRDVDGAITRITSRPEEQDTITGFKGYVARTLVLALQYPFLAAVLSGTVGLGLFLAGGSILLVASWILTLSGIAMFLGGLLLALGIRDRSNETLQAVAFLLGAASALAALGVMLSLIGFMLQAAAYTAGVIALVLACIGIWQSTSPLKEEALDSKATDDPSLPPATPGRLGKPQSSPKSVSLCSHSSRNAAVPENTAKVCERPADEMSWKEEKSSDHVW